MAEKKSMDKIDALYQWVSYDLQKIKGELMNELKLSSAQVGALYGSMKGGQDSSSSAIAQEIRYSYKQNQNIYEGLATLLKKDVGERIDAINAKLEALEQLQAILSDLSDLKHNYSQLQTVYESLGEILLGDIEPKLNALATKEEVVALVDEKVASLQENASANKQEIVAAIAESAVNQEELKAAVEESVASYGSQILETLIEKEDMKALVEESASVHSQQVLDAIAAIPTAENVDYDRITDEVGDKLLELLNELKTNEQPAEALDYERMAGDTAAKVVESLPYPDKVDYDKINEMIENAVAKVVNVEQVQSAVESAVFSALNADAIAELVASKVVMPEPVSAPEIDYDYLADLVLEKLAAKGISADILLDGEGVAQLATSVAQQLEVKSVDYDRVAAIVEEKIANGNETIEKVLTLDDEGIEKIVGGVADELRNMTLVCEYTEVEEAPVEEAIEETVEEAVEEPIVEEVVEAPVEETPVVEEAPVVEELAVAEDEPLVLEEDLEGQLIDAQTGLVVRLKRSFTAKMKQSEEQIKVYYNDVKNALTSYKRINSNVSWHGDRFNFGRETVAKMGINGKTLCFYLALDPNDPELKTTVYHQKDVGGQKAYESTPFMMKIKSDAALKKALRLVEILANKLGTEHDEKFVEVDYVAEFAYASTKQLFEQGDIKATKEKKVDFNF